MLELEEEEEEEEEEEVSDTRGSLNFWIYGLTPCIPHGSIRT
jgi:hypothetical protein